MKIRTGFVSNSSSSSFIILSPKEIYDEYYDSADNLKKMILKKFFFDINFDGIACKRASWMTGEASTISFDINDIEKAKQIIKLEPENFGWSQEICEQEPDDFCYDVEDCLFQCLDDIQKFFFKNEQTFSQRLHF